MPHQIIEISPSIFDMLDVDDLACDLHETASQQEGLPLSGLRTRIHIASRSLVADQSPNFGFIAVYLRIAEGRSIKTRKAIGEALFKCLCEHIDSQVGDAPLALSYEIQEIIKETRWNRNRVPEFMSVRENSS